MFANFCFTSISCDTFASTDLTTGVGSQLDSRYAHCISHGYQNIFLKW